MNRLIRKALPGAWLACSLLLVSFHGAHAQSDLVALGVGVQSCGEMYRLSKEKWKSNRRVSPPYQAWFEGFLSGMNVANVAHVAKRKPYHTGPWNLRKIVEAHCDENPDEDLLTVAVKIYYARETTPPQ